MGPDFREKYVDLRCPSCGSGLLITGVIRCEKCIRDWDFKDGIPCFSDPSGAYKPELSAEEMDSLILHAIKNGCESALKTHLKENHPSIYRYVSGRNRSDWRFLLSNLDGENCLDLGCGWGNISVSLSTTFKNVYSVDSDLRKLKLLKICAEKKQIENIYAVNTDFLRLPFAGNFFDAVIMIGTLEWIPESQDSVLKTIANLLKNKGQLLIGIENRFGYLYFLGKKDEHSLLRWNTLLPQVFSRLLSVLLRRKYALTHSYLKYKSMLKNAGFKKIKFFSPIPDYRFPRFIVPLDSATGYENLLNIKTKVGRRNTIGRQINYHIYKFLIDAGLIKYLSNSYIITAEKNSD